MDGMSMSSAVSSAASHVMSMATSASVSAAMSMATAASTASAASASSTSSSMSMGGMSMGSSSSSTGASCKISMLWNWYTINSCFLARSWHVKTKGQFAGSCIGVVCIGILVEIVRRLQREYDRYLLRRWLEQAGSLAAVGSADSDNSIPTKSANPASTPAISYALSEPIFPVIRSSPQAAFYTPSIFAQSIRAFLYLLQYAGAYFIMLFAMYYNGYIIICIFIGGFLGNYLFGSDTFKGAAPGLAITPGGIAPQKTCCC